MVVIRLARAGAKKRPFYHIVVADKRCPRDGRFIEKVGYFNPVAQGKAIPLSIKSERIEYWLQHGAQPSDKVRQLWKDFSKQAANVTLETATNQL